MLVIETNKTSSGEFIPEYYEDAQSRLIDKLEEFKEEGEGDPLGCLMLDIENAQDYGARGKEYTYDLTPEEVARRLYTRYFIIYYEDFIIMKHPEAAEAGAKKSELLKAQDNEKEEADYCRMLGLALVELLRSAGKLPRTFYAYLMADEDEEDEAGQVFQMTTSQKPAEVCELIAGHIVETVEAERKADPQKFTGGYVVAVREWDNWQPEPLPECQIKGGAAQ